MKRDMKKTLLVLALAAAPIPALAQDTSDTATTTETTTTTTETRDQDGMDWGWLGLLGLAGLAGLSRPKHTAVHTTTTTNHTPR
ncbi:WGxxGxxG family protein [Deinococcus aquaedulcis]|uniref:WGxxGxxG family protein n=1 Tax=Deinococcus aquaedulcis TaxID=2840455 RepID=UPI001C82CCB9|nr:WGxxGxxG family protein [Deinococcus aquaedulcis]